MLKKMKRYQGYIFDLDDTLYREHDYLKSGFEVVAEEIAQYVKKSSSEILQMLLEEWKVNGRGKVFDEVCNKLNIDLNISNLVHTYRIHKPNISLYEDAEKLLNYLQENKKQLGIITDGFSAMQWAKIESLGIRETFDCIIVTGDLGIDYWKPSDVPYRKVSDCLRIPLTDCVYIGDNPHKDFITARKLGMDTIRIIRPIGDHMQKKLSKEYEADRIIFSLEELI